MSIFTPIPAQCNLSLDQAYDWHRLYSNEAPAFVYRKESETETLTWGMVGNGVDKGVKVIQSHIPEASLGTVTTSKPLVVGILSTADPLTYTTFLMSHLRLTHPISGQPILPFLISTRNSSAAVAHLITIKNIKYIWVTEGPMQTIAKEAVNRLETEPPVILDFPTYRDLHTYDQALLNPPINIQNEVPMDQPALILHSSGSTSFPKAITLTHRVLMEWTQAIRLGDISLLGDVMAVHSSPIFHAMGILAVAWASVLGYIRAVPSPQSNPPPMTPEYFMQQIISSRATAVLCVPSFLEAWSSDPNSVSILKKMKTVLWGGGPLSQETGRYFTNQEVNIGMLYGATEFGSPAELRMKPYPEGYDWFRFGPNVSPTLIPELEAPNTFELVFKNSETHHLSSLNTEVDGVPAYATSDLIQRHEENPNLFKILGRKDDQIMLSTGEKTNPGPLEQIMIKSPKVNCALIFGRGRASNGVLIEPASYDEAEALGLEKFRSLIWPTIEQANDYAPAHSRIFKEMILIASRNKPFSYTAKSTPRRGVILKDYEQEIEDAYNGANEVSTAEIPLPSMSNEKEGLSMNESRNFVDRVVKSVLKDHSKMSHEDDIFNYGCDSLQATQIRNTIVRGLRQTIQPSKVNEISSNFVYQHPTVESMAKFVMDISRRTATVSSEDLESERRRRLQHYIHRYTQDWPIHRPGPCAFDPDAEVILLTGSTGGLGSQLLAQLVTMPTIKRIYAFNRRASKSSLERHIEAFTDRGNDLSLLNSQKIVYVEGDTSIRGLGIDAGLLKEIQNSVTTIIHNAWRVDFNLSLSSFEPAIRGVRHIIDLALGSLHPTPPRVMFTSSVGNVKAWLDIPIVPEGPLNDLSVISPVGYAESKWVSEQILEAAYHHTAMKPVIVRVGQLAGGLNGNWNTHEWFPALVRASQVVRGAPDNEGLVSFLSLHSAATSLIELRHASGIFVHLVHPRPVLWRDIIDTVATIICVPVIPYDEWLKRLEAVPKTSEVLKNNPALYLLDFYRSAAPPRDKADVGSREAMGLASYATANTARDSPSLDHLPQLSRDEVVRWIDYWESKGALDH